MNRIFNTGTAWDKIFATIFTLLCGFGLVASVVALFTDVNYPMDPTFYTLTFLFIGSALLYIGGFIAKGNFLRASIWVSSIIVAVSSFIATLITVFTNSYSSTGGVKSVREPSKHMAGESGGGYYARETRLIDMGGGHQFFKNLALAAFFVGVSLILMALFFKLYNHINNIDKVKGINNEEHENTNYTVTNGMFKITGGIWIALMAIYAMDIMFGIFEDNILLAFLIALVTGVVATYQSYFLTKYSRKEKPIPAGFVKETQSTVSAEEHSNLKAELARLQKQINENEKRQNKTSETIVDEVDIDLD